MCCGVAWRMGLRRKLGKKGSFVRVSGFGEIGLLSGSFDSLHVSSRTA